MRVEFVGGPLDGESLEVPDGMREWRMPVKEMPMAWALADEEYCPAMLDYLSTYHVYQPIGNPRVFTYRGINPTRRDDERREADERREYERLKKKFGFDSGDTP